MKNLLGILAITACIVGCGQKNQDINESAGASARSEKKSINEAARDTKDQIESDAKAAKNQVDAEAKAGKASVDAQKADAKAALTETDRKLQTELRQSLGINEADTTGQSIKADVKDGVVTLKGHVSSEQQKMDLENKAKALPGVVRVDNKLDVKN